MPLKLRQHLGMTINVDRDKSNTCTQIKLLITLAINDIMLPKPSVIMAPNIPSSPAGEWNVIFDQSNFRGTFTATNVSEV